MQYPIFFVSVNFKSSKDGADGADIERVKVENGSWGGRSILLCGS